MKNLAAFLHSPTRKLIFFSLFALGLLVLFGLLDASAGPGQQIAQFFAAEPKPRAQAAWQVDSGDSEWRQGLANDQVVYLELVEENTDTFAQQLFKFNVEAPPAPFVFDSNQTLYIDANLVDQTREEMEIYIEEGRSVGRVILLSYWNFYTGVGRVIQFPAFYWLNEPSRTVDIRQSALSRGELGGEIHFTPMEGAGDFLELRSPAGRSFYFLEAAEDGSVRFVLDGREVVLAPGEHTLLGTQTHTVKVTETSPYGSELDYGEITFTTTLTLYNYGSPTAIEWVGGDAAAGSQGENSAEEVGK